MQHDGGKEQLAPAAIVATWPKGSFAENLAIDDSGSIFVTLHTDRVIVRVDPLTGAVAPFATFETPIAGLAFGIDGTLIVSGGAPGAVPGVVWAVSPQGSVSRLADLPEAAFLNGVTPLGRRFLVADSLGGRIYSVDPHDGSVTTWLADPGLAPADLSGTPGANGIKLFRGDAYFSVTGADTILRAPMHGEIAGTPQIYAERLRADDFALDVSGALYVATHPARSLVRLAPDGERTTIAGAAQGMVGATAVAFGRTAADRHAVYVTTTGGTMTLPPENVEPAKLVRIAVGAEGAPLLAGA